MAAARRIAELEEGLAKEKTSRIGADRMARNAIQEAQQTMRELDEAEMERGLTMEEVQTERSQREALKREVEQAVRNEEIAVREMHAAERRYQHLVEEMEMVMEERDGHIADKDGLRRKIQSKDLDVVNAQNEADDALQRIDWAMNQVAFLEKERGDILHKAKADERRKLDAEMEAQVAREELDQALLERQALIRQNEELEERSHQLSQEKKAIQDQLKDRERENEYLATLKEDAEDKLMRMERSLVEAREGRSNAEHDRDRERRMRRDMEQELGDLREGYEEAREGQTAAEREAETAQRQYRGLSDEMISVLKVRDIALQQRDEARKRGGEVRMLRGGEDRQEDEKKGEGRKGEDRRRTAESPVHSSRREQPARVAHDSHEQSHALLGLRKTMRVILHALAPPSMQTASPSPVSPLNPVDSLEDLKVSSTEVLKRVNILREALHQAAHNNKELASLRSQVHQQEGDFELKAVHKRLAEANLARDGLLMQVRELNQMLLETRTEAVSGESKQSLLRQRTLLYQQIEKLQSELRSSSSSRASSSMQARLDQTIQEMHRLKTENQRLEASMRRETHELKNSVAALASPGGSLFEVQHGTRKLHDSAKKKEAMGRELDEVVNALEALEMEISRSVDFRG